MNPYLTTCKYLVRLRIKQLISFPCFFIDNNDIICTIIQYLWFTKVKYVKFSSFLISIESALLLFYRINYK